MADEAILELYRREITPELYAEIRELWKKHSIAEDARDLPGLISTLTEDCVYELVESGRRWEGHEGAARFYLGLLSAFPDITFDLTDIVIGPQGVCEEADVTGTHLRRASRFRHSSRRSYGSNSFWPGASTAPPVRWLACRSFQTPSRGSPP